MKTIKHLVWLVVIILILGGALYIRSLQSRIADLEQQPQTQQQSAVSPAQTQTQTQSQTSTTAPARATAACGPVVANLTRNQTVAFPLLVTGTIDNTAGCGWSMFEGQAGTAQLFFNYQNQGWKSLSSSVVKVDDWTASRTNFSTTLNFNNDNIGIPHGTPFKIVFNMENSSGDPSKAGPSVEFPLTY